MGFYGNITNVNSTQFTFDKIYSNRYEMERMTPTDGIYLGRYILVEYDNNLTQNDILYRQCYSKTVGGNEQFYSSPDCSESTRLKSSEIEKGQIIYVNKNNKNIYYICIGNEGVYATFKLVVQGEVPYTTNYNIDINRYGEGRGYDSTVWQKVYIGSVEKYVMIAELNSVVPTFDLAIDAPTMNPIIPHFDVDSTNVYYKLHLQPTWGFRVAEADNTNSDQTVTWKTSVYNKETDETTTTIETKSGAINFNKPAFDPQLNQVSIKKKDSTDNYITILPTGKSNNEYNTHDGYGSTSTAEDIQEMRINLPAIGNMMSDAWDIIHGPNRDNDPANSLQGRLNFFINEIGTNEIPVHHQGGYLVGAHMEDDEWIATEIDADNKKITINHTFNEGSHETVNYDVNGKEDTIDLYVPEIDEKGHIVGETVTTVTLPYGYKTIIPGTLSTAVSEIDSNTESIIADNTQDSLTVAPGNKWIRVAGDKNNDALIIAHAAAGGTTITTAGDTSDATPTFGEKFTIPYVKYDEMGHITEKGTRDIVIPVGSLTDTESSNTENVLTGIDFTPSSGAITTTHQNVGTLKLTGLIAAKENEGTYVQATDTINSGIYKIETRLDNEITNARAAETALGKRIDDLNYIDTANTSQVIYYINQSNGIISPERKNIGELLMSGYVKPTSISNGAVLAGENLNTALGKLEYRLESEVGRATNEEGKIRQEFAAADTSLKTEITSITSQISKSVSDENTRAVKAEEDLSARIDAILDGITEEELNTFKELSDALNDDADFAGTVTKAIAQEAADRTTAIAEEAAARTKADADEVSARQTAIAKETSDRESAINAINSRLDNAPSFTITFQDISKWNSAEQNIQSDWAQTDTNADDFIKNKPENIIVKSNLKDEVNAIELSGNITEQKLDENGELTFTTRSITIGELTTVIQTLINEIDSLKQQIADLTSPKVEE